MTGTAIVESIVSTLTSGIAGIASGVGAGLSTLAESIFLTGTGESQTISVFGTLIIVFSAISLGLALCRFGLLGDIKSVKKHERFNANVNGSYYLKVVTRATHRV